jgi:hypothetical protein
MNPMSREVSVPANGVMQFDFAVTPLASGARK